MNQKNKKILVITHQLSRTGAPIVLLDMIRAYRQKGYWLEVISMMDGELRADIEQMGLPLKIQEHFLQQSEAFFVYAKGFDLVVANTLITFEAVHLLKYLKVPVIWWLHEGRQYFMHFAKVLPDFRTLPPNIHVYSVGHYVQEVIEELYGVRTEILHFGVEDLPSSNVRKADRHKVRFLTAGTYSRVKAQDVLAAAIRRLPGDYQARAEFFFCGNEQMYDESVFLPVRRLCEEYGNVTLLHQLSRGETLAWMEQCDCLIVPSRVDPIPTVAAEMMMKGNICLCTDVCGIAHYMEDGVNGFTVPPEDADALADKIKYVIDCRGELEPLRRAGREIYEQYFSMDVFERKIMELAKAYIQDQG